MTNTTSEEKMEIKYRTAPNGAPLSELLIAKGVTQLMELNDNKPFFNYPYSMWWRTYRLLEIVTGSLIWYTMPNPTQEAWDLAKRTVKKIKKYTTTTIQDSEDMTDAEYLDKWIHYKSTRGGLNYMKGMLTELESNLKDDAVVKNLSIIAEIAEFILGEDKDALR